VHLQIKSEMLLHNVISCSAVLEGFDGPVISALDVRSRKFSNVDRSLDGRPKISYFELFRVSEGTSSC
jgi:hypothetical protein